MTQTSAYSGSTPPPAAASGPRHASQVDKVAVSCGVALLTTGVVLSAFYSRFRDDLDWSNYLMGLLATLGLLGVAAAGWVLTRDRAAERTPDLVAWPGAFGSIAVGLMIAVALDDSSATLYVAGLAVVALSAAGYLLTRRDPFVVTAIAGLFVVYAQLCDDVLNFGDAGDNLAISLSAALLVFTVLITAAGWLLPSRVLSGVVVGVVAVVGNAVILVGLGVVASFQAAFSGLDGSGPSGRRRFDQYDNDVWFILVFALLLIAGWAVCAYLADHVGFRLLIVAMAVSVVPTATLVLAIQHPTWWEVVIGGAGGLILLAVGVRALGRLRGVPQGGPTAGPPTTPPPTMPPPTSPPPTQAMPTTGTDLP